MSVPVSADNMWFGYKFMGDNIDKNIKPRFQRQECQAGQSLHYFHCYMLFVIESISHHILMLYQTRSVCASSFIK